MPSFVSEQRLPAGFACFDLPFILSFKFIVMLKSLLFFGCLSAALSGSAQSIMSHKQIPVICWHQIRDWRPTDSKTSRDYIMPIAAFKMHIKMLADSGYHTILPDQLYNYLTKGTPLPSKPILLTFDDTDLDQFTIARPELKKYGFKGLFFVMTVPLGKPHYMSRAQVKTLSDEGNVIGSHTWDHHNFKKYQGKDREIQLDKPTKTLEKITGKKMTYFAYPYGLWTQKVCRSCISAVLKWPSS
jgi:peptidoglycan/xylan/chitin deacetylase (PgdA/CDA1 family)